MGGVNRLLLLALGTGHEIYFDNICRLSKAARHMVLLVMEAIEIH